MKYQKTNDGKSELVIDSFYGLDRSAALCGGRGSFELRNLRCMKDGTLARRPGLVPLFTFPAEVRGAVCVTRGGREEWYAVAGDTVYCLSDTPSGCEATAIGTLTTQSGEVCFLCYDAALLMLDGEELYTLTPTEAGPAQAYVPLYGKEWRTDGTETHTVNERPNLLTPQVRLQYRMSEKGQRFPLILLLPETVDAILIDGVPYVGSYSYSKSGRVIALGKEIEAGSLVEFYVSMPENEERARVVCAKEMATIDRAESPRVLLYGIPGENGVWISRAPDRENIDSVRQVLPSACGLYVTQEDFTVIGDGVHAVTGALRHYDRSLVFTAKGTWMSHGEQNEDGTLRLIPINTTLGCSQTGGAVMLGNRPITAFGGRILAWNSETDERDECNATPISAPVEPLLRNMRRGLQAFADTEQGDAWFYCPGKGGRLLIYQSEVDAWTTYDGISPQCIAQLGDRVTVGMGRTLYRMDEEATADTLVDDEHPEGVRVGIAAQYQSAFWDFDASDHVKRLCRATVVAACSDHGVTLTLQNVSGKRTSLALKGDGGELSVMQGRAPMGRFRFLRVGVSSDDDAPLRLHSIRLSARCP